MEGKRFLLIGTENSPYLLCLLINTLFICYCHFQTLGCSHIFEGLTSYVYIYIFFFSPMPPHVLMNFHGFPPGCGDNVADF